MAEIVELGAHERMSTSEALGLTIRENPSEVLILYIDNDGELGVRSSGMSNKDALWLVECARNKITRGDDYDG